MEVVSRRLTHNSVKKPWILLALILAAGAALRLHLLGAKSIWIDEAVGVALAQSAWASFWREVWAYEGNMALYYLLLRGWIHLGESEVAIRSLSVLFGVAAIAAISLLGERLFGRKAGLIAAALLALHAFHIQFSQEARSYSLLIFLLIGSTYFFLRALEAPHRRGYWVAYALVSALVVYGHVLAILVIAAQWLALNRARLKQIGLTTVLGIGAAGTLLAAPMGAFVLFHNKGQLEWIPRLTPERLLEAARYFVGGRSNALLAAYLGFSLLGAARGALAKRRNLARAEDNLPVRLVALWLVFPIVAMLGVSLFRPLFFYRYLILCVPALVLLAAHGMVALERIFPRLGGAALVAPVAILGLALNGVAHYYETFPYMGNDWRSASQHILDRQQPGDAALFYIPAGYRPFLYYAGRESAGKGPAVSPAIVFPTPAVRHTDYQFQLSRPRVELLTRGHRRVWVVLHLENAHPGAPIPSLLPEDLRFVEERQFSGFHGTGSAIRVALYRRRLDSGPQPPASSALTSRR